MIDAGWLVVVVVFVAGACIGALVMAVVVSASDRRAEIAGQRNVRMSVELMDAIAEAAVGGGRASVDWGDPDADGFYTPTVTAHR